MEFGWENKKLGGGGGGEVVGINFGGKMVGNVFLLFL